MIEGELVQAALAYGGLAARQSCGVVKLPGRCGSAADQR